MPPEAGDLARGAGGGQPSPLRARFMAPSSRCGRSWSLAGCSQPLPKPQALHAAEPAAVLPGRWRKHWFSLL